MDMLPIIGWLKSNLVKTAKKDFNRLILCWAKNGLSQNWLTENAPSENWLTKIVQVKMGLQKIIWVKMGQIVELGRRRVWWPDNGEPGMEKKGDTITVVTAATRVWMCCVYYTLLYTIHCIMYAFVWMCCVQGMPVLVIVFKGAEGGYFWSRSH